MLIIAAAPEDAAWNVHHHLTDLLGWSKHPDSNALNDGWADSYKRTIVGVVESAARSFSDDQQILQKLKTIRKLAHEFIALMRDRPKLSTIPREEWTVPSYCQLFDDLAELDREFRILSEDFKAPSRKTREPAEELEPPRIPARVKRPKTKKRWTVHMIEEHIREVLSGGDYNLIQSYIFDADHELAQRITCNKQTLYKTEFWTSQRKPMQAEWRRRNAGREIPKKRDQ